MLLLLLVMVLPVFLRHVPRILRGPLRLFKNRWIISAVEINIRFHKEMVGEKLPAIAEENFQDIVGPPFIPRLDTWLKDGRQIKAAGAEKIAEIEWRHPADSKPQSAGGQNITCHYKLSDLGSTQVTFRCEPIAFTIPA